MWRKGGLVALSLLAGASLILALWLAYNDKSGAAATIGVLGLLILVFVQLSRFKKVRGLGFEAELWEDKQQEAEAIINRTRKLLTLLSTTLLTAAPRMGRWSGGFSRKELLRLAKDLETNLQAAGVAQKDVGNVYAEIDKFVAIDLAAPICKGFRQAVNRQASDMESALNARLGSPIRDQEEYRAGIEKISAVRQCAFDTSSMSETALPDWAQTIRERIRNAEPVLEGVRNGVLADYEEALLDLAAFTNGRNIRRPAVFFDESEEG